MAKSKLNKLKQADGKLRDDTKELNSLMSTVGLNKYGTLDEKEYLNKLNEMAKTPSELYHYAQAEGYKSDDNHKSLIEKMMADFKRHVASFNTPKEERSKPKQMSEDVIRFCKQGA